MWSGPKYRYLRDLVTVPLICWLSSALKNLQQKEISHLHSRSLLEMTATNTVSSVYQTNVVLMLEKIRLNAVQPKNNARAKSGARSCYAARTRKPQQEAKVPYFCGLTARTVKHKKSKIFTARS